MSRPARPLRHPTCTFNQQQRNGILNGPYAGFLH